jgi:tripartite ATP-independent transporter DctM subunit
VAGIIPGLLLMSLFLIYVLYRVWRDPSLAPDVASDLADTKVKTSVIVALLRILPCAFVFFMVMGLIMFGVATPTEAAATGVFGAIVVAIIYRKFSLPMLWESLITAATVSALLLVIMCCAVMFSQLLTFTGATRAVAELVAHLDLPAVAMLFMMMALPFVLFMFLDQLALMLVLIPIYQPLLKLYAFDPIWFWTLFLIVATVGGLTPPFGYVLYAFKSAAPDVPLTEVYRASWPFVWLIVLGMVILIIVPDLVTFLPNLTRPR